MNDSPLISADQLSLLMSREPKLLILDVRFSLVDPSQGRRAYDQGHVPGAHFVDLESDVSGCRSGTNGRHPLPDSGRFCVNMRRLGLNPDSVVVVYDDGSCTHAARLWLTLRWVGFRDTRVLDGGYRAWQDEGNPSQTEEPSWEPGTYRATTPLERIFDDETVARSVADRGPWLLLDARAPERYRGDSEPIDPIAGHIPGALNRPSCDNLGPDGRFKSPEALAAEFRDLLGEDGPARTVNYCGSGIVACGNHLAMTVAGLSPAGVYIGSWSEWIADEDRPIATGDNP